MAGYEKALRMAAAAPFTGLLVLGFSRYWLQARHDEQRLKPTYQSPANRVAFANDC